MNIQCVLCRKIPQLCCCPVCPICGMVGDLECINFHYGIEYILEDFLVRPIGNSIPSNWFEWFDQISVLYNAHLPRVIVRKESV
jgi:hypothetical protein